MSQHTDCDFCKEEIRADDTNAIHTDLNGQELDLCGRDVRFYESWKAREEEIADEIAGLLAARQRENLEEFWAQARAYRESKKA